MHMVDNVEGKNLRCFENVDNSMQQVKIELYLEYVFFWCNQLYSNDIVFVVDVLDLL